jgi:hypothetical protein
MSERWHNPIVLLKSDLQNTIEHITGQFPEALRQQLIDERVSVLYDDRPRKIRTPGADIKGSQVILQDVHLAFLWCCSYITVALNTMLYNEAHEDSSGNIVHLGKRSEFPMVAQTIRWAKSLRDEVTQWPIDTARPDVADQWTEAATNLFQATVSYLFFHELGHLFLHKELLPNITARNEDPFYTFSDDQNNLIYSAEIEADEFALNRLMGNSVLDDVRLIKYLGASVAHLSNFYLLDIADTRGGVTHPDLDDRLKSVINKALFNREADTIQFRMHIISGLQLFLTLTQADFILDELFEMEFSQVGDLEAQIFDLIDRMKKTANSKPRK